MSLWLEALEPGRPLSFLDHHIRVGNSLLGGAPELIAAGLPDSAFTATEGDDKKACAVLKKRNKGEREGWGPMFAQQNAETQARLEQVAAALEELPDDRPEDIRAKEVAFRRHEQTEEYRHKKQLADAWCAAFVIRKHFREPGRENSASGITQGHLSGLAAGRPLPADLAAETVRLLDLYQFFHQRDELDYTMDTFSIVEEKDREKFGDFRSKELILTAFDGIQQRSNPDEILAKLLKNLEA